MSDEQFGATLTDESILKLTKEHPNINIGKDAIPDESAADYIAELSSNFNGWSFRSNGYLNQVFTDPNKLSGMVMLANKTDWSPENGWQDWIENQANNSDVARMMRTHSKIVISHTLVGGDINVRTMISSDLDRLLFFNKFLQMHLDWNTYGFTIAEPVFSKKDPEREKQLALQRVYKTKPTANEGSAKHTYRMAGGVEPTTRVPYAQSDVNPSYTSNQMVNAKDNPFPWVETQSSLPVEDKDRSNDDIDVNWEWHIVDLLILNPNSIRVCRNNLEDVQYLRSKFGNGKNEEWSDYVNSAYCDAGNGAYIIAFVQYPFNEQGMESVLFYPHELIFIPRYPSHSYPNGVSQLREAYKEIVLREILEESMVATAKRWGDPIMKFTVQQNIWQKRDLVKNLLQQVKYSRSMGMDIVVPEGIETETIESSGGVDLIGGPLEYVQNKLNKIMQWADSFTESDSSNRSLGDVQLAFMEIDAEPERKLFASVFYKCILLPLVVANGYKESDCPVMSFDPINPKDTLDWGNFYAGLVDMMDAGQLNSFFEFIDLPFTEPITESPMERERRLEQEELAAEKAREERDAYEFGEETGDFDEVGGDDMEDNQPIPKPGVVNPNEVSKPEFPSPFGTKPTLAKDEFKPADVSEVPLEEKGDASLSARHLKAGRAEALNAAVAKRGLKQVHNSRINDLNRKLGFS